MRSTRWWLKAGHQLKKKGSLAARCDSFVVETNVHYPTDINLLLDAMRKTITLTGRLCQHDVGLGGWRQSAYNCRQVKRAHRRTQKMKRSSSPGCAQASERQQEVVKAHRDYVALAAQFIRKEPPDTGAEVVNMGLAALAKALAIQSLYPACPAADSDQIERRVIARRNDPPPGKGLFHFSAPHRVDQ